MKFVVGITGASGSIYGIRLIEVLSSAGHEVHAVVTRSGWQVLAHECQVDSSLLKKKVTALYDIDAIGASIASGSFLLDAMIVAPCSMTVSPLLLHRTLLLHRLLHSLVRWAVPLIVIACSISVLPLLLHRTLHSLVR